MSETLKRQFYAACPVWYWPALWWQFVVMERYLAYLYAASGRAEMTYGLALCPRGQLRLVFLSDAARNIAEGKAIPALVHHLGKPVRLEHPPADDLRHQASPAENAHASQAVCTTPPSFPLHLDPG